jgi:hypothetical protein
MAITYKNRINKWLKENTFHIYEQLETTTLPDAEMRIKNKLWEEVIFKFRKKTDNDIIFPTHLGFTVSVKFNITKTSWSVNRRRFTYNFQIKKDENVT